MTDDQRKLQNLLAAGRGMITGLTTSSVVPLNHVVLAAEHCTGQRQIECIPIPHHALPACDQGHAVELDIEFITRHLVGTRGDIRIRPAVLPGLPDGASMVDGSWCCDHRTRLMLSPQFRFLFPSAPTDSANSVAMICWGVFEWEMRTPEREQWPPPMPLPDDGASMVPLPDRNDDYQDAGRRVKSLDTTLASLNPIEQLHGAAAVMSPSHQSRLTKYRELLHSISMREMNSAGTLMTVRDAVKAIRAAKQRESNDRLSQPKRR